jgi:DNA-binding transcriptional MerR regulator
VERLRFILVAQRDRYLPLRVIKDHLEAADQTGGPRALPAEPVRLSRAQLLERAGIDEETLAELEDYGLVAPIARQYDTEALDLARVAGALVRFGLHPRHLRVVKAAVDRETSLIEQVVAPLTRRKAPGAPAQAAETAHEISGLLERLHGTLLRDSVRDVLGR